MSIKWFVSILALVLFSTNGALALESNDFETTFKIRIFSAIWCGPCHELHAALEQAGATENLTLDIDGEQIKAQVQIVTDEDMALKEKQTDSFPETQILKNGVRIGVFAGYAGSLDLFKKDCSHVIGQYLTQKTSLKNLETPEFVKNKKIKKATAIFLGTGSDANDNPIFIGLSLRFVSDVLEKKFELKSENRFTLYGDTSPVNTLTEAFAEVKPGDQIPWPGVLSSNGDRFYTKIPKFSSDSSFTPENLSASLKQISDSNTDNVLLVMAGHGQAAGIKTWKQSKFLDSSGMATVFESVPNKLKNAVIVSGTCHGGNFVDIPRCGFFASRPDTNALGCSGSFDQIDYGKMAEDYSAQFFKALETKKSDFDGDGQMSFEEAHLYATAFGNQMDATYTSFDSLADRYFEENTRKLPDSISTQEIRKLFVYASAGERVAIEKLMTESRLINGKPMHSFFLKQIKAEVNKVAFFQFKEKGETKTSIVTIKGSVNISPFVQKGFGVVGFDLSGESSASLKILINMMNGNIDSDKNLSAEIRPFKNQKGKFSLIVAYRTKKGTTDEFDLSRLGVSFELPFDLHSYEKTYFRDTLYLSNPKMAKLYKRALPQLIRRVLFKKEMALGNVGMEMLAKAKDVMACEAQSFENYFSTPKENF